MRIELRVALIAVYMVFVIPMFADWADDTLKQLGSSDRVEDKISLASVLRELIAYRGLDRVGRYYERFLADPSEDVIAETLMAIRDTPNLATIPGDKDKILAFFKKMQPRVQELCNSRSKTIKQCARQANHRIYQLEKAHD